MKCFYLIACWSSCLIACVSTALPTAVIPGHAGELNGGIAAGLLGIQTDIQYALGARHTVGGAYSLYAGPGPVHYGEIRLGTVHSSRSRMVTAAFGHGKFDLNLGFPVGGQSGVISNYYGHFHKASITWTRQFPSKKVRFGLLIQGASYWGHGNGICFTGCNPFYNRLFVLPISVTAMASLRFGRDGGIALSAGGTLSLRENSDTHLGDADFIPNPAAFALGWVIPIIRKRGQQEPAPD